MTINIFGIKVYIGKRTAIVTAVVLVTVLSIAGYIINNSGNEVIINAGDDNGIISSDNTSSGDNISSTDSSDDKEKDEIKVYVVGCVKNPGVVTLKKGQLIDDAIKAAGGVTEDADLENINLVYKLNCNVMLNIRSKDSQETLNGSSDAGTGIEIIIDSGGVVANESGTNMKININIASVSQLETLPGVGEATAKEIIAYRDKNGGFDTIEDIMKVSGIKEGRFDQVRDYITVN